ncbi:MAG: ParA family protein [Clostridiales bacterium]|nr:ParA family protein [Clostridiales bacterium]
MAKIIAVSNQKGGVGKTTTAVNLSACLAEAGKQVLLVDCDPQGNATSGLGHPGSKGKSIYEVLINGLPVGESITDTCCPGLSLLPSDIALAGAEIELVSMAGRETMLKGVLTPIRGNYDYILIDCPPSLGLLTLNAMTAADSVLVPIQCEYYAMEGVGQLMNTLNLVRRHLNPALQVEGVLLTMLDGRTNLGLQVVDEVKKHFRDRVFSSVVPRNVRLGEAPSHGLPIHLYDKNCPGTQAYRELAREVIDRNENPDWQKAGQ